jgi:hypothetical protein
MASSAVVLTPSVARVESKPGVPWTIWAGALAVTSSTIGGAWDVAWHRSIGRDSFLTSAHLAIYACGVIAALICGYLILYTTFGGAGTEQGRRMKAESVSVLGFRAPLGAFIAAWGGIAMLTSAPFDNWWHAAYGLDVKIISPPHTLLILGIRCVSLGVVFLILAAMNRLQMQRTTVGLTEQEGSTYRTLQKIFLYLGGMTVLGQMFFLQEETWDVKLHRTSAYIALAIGVPVALAAISKASGNRWAATIASAIYTVFVMGEILILPLVSASPKLGPVFFPVTHLVPGKFPVLIVVPAIVLDVLWFQMQRRGWKMWQVAAVSGAVFVAVLAAVEWPLANFLMSKASENRFFGTIYFDYNSRAEGFDRMRKFFDPASGTRLAMGLAWAMVYAAISTWVGLLFGRWMRGIQR